MDNDWNPWPLSELEAEDRRRIIAMPPQERQKRIERLKKDILSGEHARRQRRREQERG